MWNSTEPRAQFSCLPGYMSHTLNPKTTEILKFNINPELNKTFGQAPRYQKALHALHPLQSIHSIPNSWSQFILRWIFHRDDLIKPNSARSDILVRIAPHNPNEPQSGSDRQNPCHEIDSAPSRAECNCRSQSVEFFFRSAEWEGKEIHRQTYPCAIIAHHHIVRGRHSRKLAKAAPDLLILQSPTGPLVEYSSNLDCNASNNSPEEEEEEVNWSKNSSLLFFALQVAALGFPGWRGPNGDVAITNASSWHRKRPKEAITR